jgi:hypothetical protein
VTRDGSDGLPVNILVRLKGNAISYNKIEHLLLFRFELIVGLQAKSPVDISIMVA